MRLVGSFCLFLLVVVALAGWTDGEEVRTEIVIELPEGHQGPVEGTILRSWLDEAKGEIVQDEAPLDLPGVWASESAPGQVRQIQVLAPGYWSPPVLAGPAGGTVRIELLATGRLQGLLQVPRGEDLPRQIGARFEQAAGVEGDPSIPRGTVSCPVDLEQKAFHCEIPAGQVDLRLRAQGFVSHYRWGLTVVGGKAVPVGLLALQRGGSVVGQVELSDAKADLAGMVVRLTPVQAGHARGRGGAARMDRRTLEAETGPRGFFHIAGVPPGRFRAQVEREGFGRARSLPVQVFRNTETRIPQPLRLSPPVRLALEIVPALDPHSLPWWVEVRETNLAGTASQGVAEGRSSEDGTWRTPPIPEGKYRITLIDSQGSRWLSREVTTEAVEDPVLLEVPMLPLSGRITLAGEPLAATLYFGGRSNAESSLQVEANEEGKFDGFLPREGTWVVEVQSMDPRLTRRLEGVSVPKVEGGWLETEIVLPPLKLEGEIVGTDGEPIRGSAILVDLAGGKRPEQVLNDSQGRFRFYGLEPGAYSLQALASGGQLTSDRLEVDVTAEEPDPYLSLQVLPPKAFSGRVVSASGPVVGAMVSAAPLVDGEAASMILPRQQTDVEGRFHLSIPQATEQLHITVLAPGYGLKTQLLKARWAGPVTLQVYRQAGSLVLQFPTKIQPGNFTRSFYLEQNGLDLAFLHLMGWLRIHPESIFQPGLVRIPMVEFGEFRFCARGQEEEKRCAGGYLAPQGELVLALPVGSLPP